MIFDKIDVNTEAVKVSLLLAVENFESSWCFYKKQYMECLDFFFGIANQKKYKINKEGMPFLFIFRHTVELALKEKISKTNINFSHLNTHSLSELLNLIEDDALPSDFLSKLSVLNVNNDGSCFRYIKDKEGCRYWKKQSLEAYSAAVYFSSICQEAFSVNMQNRITDSNMNKMKGELTVYTDNLNLGQLRTCYDFALSEILGGINGGQLNINDVYLPVLFLVRHGLELAFKQSLADFNEKLTDKQKSKIDGEHSLKLLFAYWDEHLNISIKNMGKNLEEVRKKARLDRVSTVALQNKLSLLDQKSYAFRFPFDDKGNPLDFHLEREAILDIVKLYQEVDSYVTFATPYFQQIGIV